MKSQTYSSLHDVFLLKLQSLYDIESEIIKALPKMIKRATYPELKSGFEDHLEVTKMQKERLEDVFDELGEKSKKVSVDAIRGLIKDVSWLLQQKMTPEARDASLIAAAQYIEHYEIAGYGTALAWAEEMGHDTIADMLQETLDEERQADETLTVLAEHAMNEKALQPMIND
jgi:ferritin-like metal-binding protein YciE